MFIVGLAVAIGVHVHRQHTQIKYTYTYIHLLNQVRTLGGAPGGGGEQRAHQVVGRELRRGEAWLMMGVDVVVVGWR